MPFNEKIINERNGNIAALVEIMRALRDRDKGCPWDIEQTFESISQYTIEEAYEVVDAIDRKDWDNLKTELGDLLLQSIYHSQIASEKEYFNFNDVVREVSDKMVSRHPHVFGEDKVNKTSQQQIEDWETIKAAERESKHQVKVLDGVAVNLPALVRAIKLQKRASRVGFDWPSYENVLDKIIEEARELTDAAADANSANTEEEFGDLLFTFVNLGRHLNIDAEIALKKTNDKFKKRFDFIETELEKKGKKIQDTSLSEMDVLWEKAKKILK